MKLTLSRIGMVLIAVPFLIQIVLFLFYSHMLRTAELQESRMERTKELVSHTNWVFGVLAASSLFCAEYAVTEDKFYRDSFQTAVNATRPEPNVLLTLLQSGALRGEHEGSLNWMDQLIEKLTPLTDRSKNQQEGILVRQCRAVLKLIDLMNQLVKELQPIAAKSDAHDRSKAMELLSRDDLKGLWQQIVTARSEVIETDHLLYKIRGDESLSSREKVKELINLGVLFDVVVAFVFMLLFSKYITARLNVLTTNSERLAHGESLLRPMSGNDEISDLDKSFHQMAEALNEAARKERAVVDNARDLICTIDRAGRFQRINPAAETILGQSPQSMIDQPLVDFVSEADRKRVSDTFEKLIEHEDTEPFELTMKTRSGATLDMLVSAHYSAADNSIFCVMHDVTQRRQMERMKRQFLAMITHDLRSPLAAIGNTLELLTIGVYDPSSEKGQNSIKSASTNVERMLRLISDLLEMEKFEAANLSLDIKPVSLKSIIDEAIDSVKAIAEQQNLSIERESVDLQIEADQFRIVQVLVNLISNAIKFSPPSGTVKVRAIILSNGDQVQVEVTDCGSGISEEERDSIFEPYKQAMQERRGDIAAGSGSRLGGTGLGLTICKSIVEGHQGSIGVMPAEPKGSTFWFRLPVKHNDAQE